MWENVEYISNLIKHSLNKTDVLNKLNLKNNGGNFNTLSSFIRKYNLDIEHFTKRNGGGLIVKKDINDVLSGIIPYSNTTNLKKRLYNEGLKFRLCELCGQNEEWNGNKMSLILDHINGDRYDNRLENLQIVCPNCNATLDTHCRGLKKKKVKKVNIKKVKESLIKDSFHDSMNIRRKVERPSYDTLLEDLRVTNYTKTGEKYGVSDNCIRKWIKMYEKHGINY